MNAFSRTHLTFQMLTLIKQMNQKNGEHSLSCRALLKLGQKIGFVFYTLCQIISEEVHRSMHDLGQYGENGACVMTRHKMPIRDTVSNSRTQKMQNKMIEWSNAQIYCKVKMTTYFQIC